MNTFRQTHQVTSLGVIKDQLMRDTGLKIDYCGNVKDSFGQNTFHKVGPSGDIIDLFGQSTGINVGANSIPPIRDPNILKDFHWVKKAGQSSQCEKPSDTDKKFDAAKSISCNNYLEAYKQGDILWDL